MMPHLDGIAVLGQLRAEIPADVYVPVLVLTADATPDAKRRALAAGARDFLTKPFEQFEVLLRIRNLLDTRRLHVALETHNRALEVTVRQRTEQLLQSEKVATMGSLLAGVAHELNNPLAVLSGQAQLLQGQAGRPGHHAADAQDRRGGRPLRAHRAQLPGPRAPAPARAHAHQPQAGGARGDRAAGLRAAHGQRGGRDGPRRRPARPVGRRPPAPPGPREPDRQRAPRDAPPAGHEAHHLQGRFDRERNAVRLAVADTGPGIPPAVRARIFEAFYTTKPAGEGTGLGLSLCRSIIEEHGGTIAVESVEGTGTTFVIDLPATRPPATRTAAEAVESLPAVGARKILIVDDEVAIADVVAEALERDGHTADIAANGLLALEMMDRKSYDAVLSDTKMPVLDGESFYAEMVRKYPQLAAAHPVPHRRRAEPREARVPGAHRRAVPGQAVRPRRGAPPRPPHPRPGRMTWGPRYGPQTPRRSSRPGLAVALLCLGRRDR